jgi:hypothetical protein
MNFALYNSGQKQNTKEDPFKETRERISGQSPGAPPSHSEHSSFPARPPTPIKSPFRRWASPHMPTRAFMPKRMRAAKAAPAFAMLLMMPESQPSFRFSRIPLRAPQFHSWARMHERATGKIADGCAPLYWRYLPRREAASSRGTKAHHASSRLKLQLPIFRHASDSQISAR